MIAWIKLLFSRAWLSPVAVEVSLVELMPELDPAWDEQPEPAGWAA